MTPKRYTVSLELEELAELYGEPSVAEQYIAELEQSLRQALKEERDYAQGERVYGTWVKEASKLLGEEDQ